MAIEAINQVADHSRQITGFKINDAHLLNVLRIPLTAEGIETQFQLRSLKDGRENNSLASEFRLYACDKGHWTTIGHGVARVVYHEEKNNIDGTKEADARLQSHKLSYNQTMIACRESTSKKPFYERLREHGYTFGPDFRVLDELYSTEDHRAIATVDCYPWLSDSGKNLQPHIIHPVTLDGAFQIALAAYGYGFKSDSPAAVPSSIKSLWVTSSGLSVPQSKRLRVYGGIKDIDNLGFEGSVTGFDHELKNVVLEVSGIRTRFIRSVFDLPHQNQRQIGWRVSWMPDMELLDPNSVATFCQNLSPATQSEGRSYYDPLGKYLSVLTFKNPQMNILQINSGCGERTEALLQQMMSFQGRKDCSPCYKRWTFTDSTEVNLTDAKNTLAGHVDMHFQQLDIKADPLKQGYEGEAYDIILASKAYNATSLANIRKLVKPLGNVVLIDAENVDSHDGDVESTLARSLTSSRTEAKDFSDRIIQLSKDEPKTEREYTTILSTHGSALSKPTVPLRFLLIVNNSTGPQARLAQLVRSSLPSGSYSSCEITTFSALFTEQLLDDTVLVSFHELEGEILSDLSPNDLAILRKTLPYAKGVLWLNGGGGTFGGLPGYTVVEGLSRVLRLENERLKFVVGRLEPIKHSVEYQAQTILKIIHVTDFASLDQTYEAIYLQMNGLLYINRLLEAKNLTEKIHLRASNQEFRRQNFNASCPLKLTIGVPGLLETLHYVEDTTPQDPLLPDEVEVKVHAVGLNFKDLLLALGRVSGTTFGNECAGVVSRVGSESGFMPGDRVCLLTTAAFNTFVRAKAAGIARVPDDMSLTVAATVPTQFGTAYYAIHNLARMQQRESILIHSGAGGTGQAAIQIAKNLNAEIFVTVGSNEKKQFLIESYNIPEDHIFYSRATNFLSGIKRMTNGLGVDVVLNSLSGEGFLASWACIAPYGRFIELGKTEAQNNASLPMEPFLRNATFASFEGSLFAAERPALAKAAIENVLDLFAQGKAKPVEPLKVMDVADTVKALRLLQSGTSIGKFVLEITENSMVTVSS